MIEAQLQWPMDPDPPTDSEREGTTAFGVDTVSLSAPAPPGLLDHLDRQWLTTRWDPNTGERVSYTAGGSGFLAVGATYTMVTVRRSDTEPRVTIRFSAPKMLSGHNTVPMRVDLLPDIASIAAEALGIPTRGNWIGGMHLNRLDIASDLEVETSAVHVLEGLARRERVRRVRLHEEDYRRTGELQTLTWATRNRWRMVVYDKSHKLREDANRAPADAASALRAWADLTPRGRLRCELQLRGPVLRELKMTDPGGFDEAQVESVFMRYADRCRLVEGIHNHEPLRAWAESSLSAGHQREVAGLLAHLSAALLGVPSPQSRPTERKYRRLARDLGLSPRDLVPSRSMPSYLDFKEHREVRD